MAGQFINAPSPSRREARNFENELDIVIVGNKSDKNVTSGQYVTVRDSSISGITNGIYKATANVAAGTAFVAANLDAVTSGALNDLNGNLASLSDRVNAKTFGSSVNILSYTSSNKYTLPSDGYVAIKSGDAVNDYVVVTVGNASFSVKTQVANYNEYNAVFAKAGMQIYILAKSGSNVTATFYPIS